MLALDAGNTKTDAAVIAADGTLLAGARGGGFRPQAVGTEAAVDVLQGIVERALADAGRPTVAGVTACLANADLPQEEVALRDALAERGWGARTEVANDTFAILRAGLDDDGRPPQGVAVVCGAGINCAGQRADGTVHRFAALGALSGDWGGGGGLADSAIWHAARAEDGRGADTELARALPAHYGLTTMAELIAAFHLGALGAGRRHEATPVLFDVAARGDRIARGIVLRQVEELVALVTVTLERLELGGVPTPVLLGGSVVAARHPLLHDALLERLAERAPHAAVRVVTAPPVLGAGLLALDAAGAGTAALGRLRAAYEDTASGGTASGNAVAGAGVGSGA
ncbi:ATPase [Streptomyces sp. XM4193]|uniref:N-acetylglucosamine kinase n=1 Tax=Streptomyces sp. XM4193 TaxID=2929782 RepID=UPI001FFA472B|nr:BadF/BadG/BcrA/BcrD ATPase family protein [Streptomyces sp. XM4193]MCK1795818.1 ATPase [Streptomyces sp. XM4193]